MHKRGLIIGETFLYIVPSNKKAFQLKANPCGYQSHDRIGPKGDGECLDPGRDHLGQTKDNQQTNEAEKNNV